MTIEQLEARKEDLNTKLQQALVQKKQIKQVIGQLQGALLVTDEYITAMKGNGLAEGKDERPDV
jgi:hypothetical protein